MCVVLVVIRLPFKHVMPADVKHSEWLNTDGPWPLGAPRAPCIKVTKCYVTYSINTAS